MSLFGQPFGTDLQNQYLQQLQVMQQAQQAQPILDEINREVGSLTSRTYWLKHKNIKWLNRPMRQDLWHS